MSKLKKVIVTIISCLLLMISAVVGYIIYMTPVTATVGGYYEPMTIYFNNRNSMSLFNWYLMQGLEEIDFPQYYVKSLYPHAKVRLNGTEYNNVYVWKLKLKETLPKSYLETDQKLEEIKMTSNYPFPKEMTFYRLPACSTLILGVDKSRHAFLIQITNESEALAKQIL